MSQKRYGPTSDAGTVILEKDAEKTIQGHMLGSTAYTGILERGKVNDLIIASGKKDLFAKTGGYIPDSLLPDAAVDFWDHGQGAGVLFLYRVDDGSGVLASSTVWDRKTPRNKVLRIDANNVGKWAGANDICVVDLTTVPTDITETTVTLPSGFLVPKNKWKDGTLTLTGPAKTYNVVSNTEGTASVRAVITLAADSKALTDYGAGSDKEVVLSKTNYDVYGRERVLSYEILDGELNPTTEWGLKVYVNGELVKKWSDLSSDPNASNYFVSIINKDSANYYIAVTDLWSGAITAACRPANWFGYLATGVITATQIALNTMCVAVDSSLASNNTLASFTFGASVIPDTYVLEVTGTAPTTWQLTSSDKQKGHVFTAPTDGVAYTADNAFSIGFTATGVTPVIGEKWTIYVLPLVEDEAIGGRIFMPDVSAAPKAGWAISDNTEVQVNIASGDLTCTGTIPANVNVRLQYPQKLWGGYDGIHKLATTNFTAAYDVSTSPFNRTADQGYGLIKHATPGIWKIGGSVDSTLVQKAGTAYADAKNHQFRAEIQDTVTDEFVAKAYIFDTLGKSDYSKNIFPSYAYVADPIRTDRLKLVSVTGMVHGEEARMAKNYDGYHKVGAGTETKLYKIKELTTGDALLNGEVLNPAGIPRIVKKMGNFIIWGARLPASDPAWKWSQQRELLSYYEHVLAESYDWVMFAINDPIEQPKLVSSLQSFFIPEWTKRALRGNTFEDACKIKIDAENNTDLTRAAGNMCAEISLRLADTIERFIITISKQGIFESSTSA